MAHLYEVLFRFKPDGTYKGSHARDWDGMREGPVRPLADADLDGIMAAIEEGLLARVAEVEDQLLAEREAHAAAMEELRASLTAAPAPGSVTARQIRLALIDAGIDLDQIAALLADNPAALVEWEYAATIERDHPLVLALGGALQLDSEDVSDLFAAAATK